MPTTEEHASAEVFDALDTGLIVLDRDERVTGWNAWTASASRIVADRALGRRLDEIFPGVALQRLQSAIGEALEAGASSIITHSLHPMLLPLQTRAGRELIHNLSIRPIGRARSGCLVQISDVTHMAHRERVLRERQNARYDAVVTSASDPILTLDDKGLIQLANHAAASQFGYSQQELMGRPITLLIEEQETWGKLWSSVLRGEALTSAIEIVARRQDGSPSYLEISASRWFSDSRPFVTVILRDVNQRRAAEEALRGLNQTLEQRVEERTAELMHAEEQLRQSQKMEAVGQLTGGIAHDFNNLLAGIVGALDLMETRVEQGRTADLPRYIAAAMTSAQRAASLTHRLLAFSRRQPLDPKPIDANRMVSGMEDLLRRTMGPLISLEIVPCDGLWRILCDRVQLESALLNLCINSRDAMPDGGTLTIETANADLGDGQSAARIGVEPGEYVELCVRDTGSGMPAHVTERAFDPFFTTKPTGQGTGLGLSMVYGFAKQSEGHARIYSEPGQGTTVRIYLPRYLGTATEETSDAPAVEDAAARSGGSVLVVEDETILRDLIVEVLQDLGYRTLTAVDGPAGLEILRSSEPVDLLVTDIGLPGIDGRQLAEHARQSRPGMKVLFITGYAMNATVAAGFLGPGMALITKPFAVNAFARKVQQVIAWGA